MHNQSLFEFVGQFSSDLAELARRIENQLFEQPHASLIQARLYTEQLVKIMSKEEGLEDIYPLKHSERIHKLYRENVVEEDIYMKLEWIRKKGNKAAHDVKEVEIHDVLQVHKFLFEISVWYMEVYVSYDFEAPAYTLPIKTAQQTNPLRVKDLDILIKPYFDQTLQKMENMWSEVHRQFEAIRKEKEQVHMETSFSEAVGTQQAEAAVTIITSQDAPQVLLQFKNETLLVTGELVETSILELPINGCNYLVRELSRVGIDSLLKITEPMDFLYMKLNGVGPHTIEKFWNQLLSIQGSGKPNHVNKEDNQTIASSKETGLLYGIFSENNFKLTNETAKAAEFENMKNNEVVYLLPNKEITIVLNPNTIENHSNLKSDADHHNTAFRKFPKKIKNGKTPTNYGYAFKFKTEDELNSFLKSLNNVLVV